MFGMRKLRNKIFGEESSMTTPNNTFTNNTVYSLDSNQVDYRLSRQLYYNTHDKYKLGAGFCKPIINSLVGFIGVPRFESNDINAIEVIQNHLEDIDSTFTNITRGMIREGDYYLLVTYKNNKSVLYPEGGEIELRSLLPERVKPIMINGELKKVIITTKVEFEDENKNKVKYKAVESWTDETYKITYEDIDVPNYLKDDLNNDEVVNDYGFIPIIWFKNENEDFNFYGASELEPVEPFLRAYHDVMFSNVENSKLNGKPKLLFKAKDINKILEANFSEEEIESGSINLSGKDVLFLSQEDNGEYIQISATTHSALLEFIYMCIVDVSETPEFMFGTAVASSRASVSEQLLPFIRKIKRKRAELNDNYKLLCRMVFAIHNKFFILNPVSDFKVRILWEDLDKQDEGQNAIMLNNLINALVTAVSNKLMSYESAINYLSKYIETMSKYNDSEDDTASEKNKINTQLLEMGDLEDFQSEITAIEENFKKRLDGDNE